MANSIRREMKQHVESAGIQKDMLEYLRTIIQKSIDTKQLLIEEYEKHEETEEKPETKKFLMAEQERNQDFLNTVKSLIDCLTHTIKCMNDTLATLEYVEEGDVDED